LAVAGERLSEMSDEGVASAMDAKGFRTAALELAKSACTTDPFRQETKPSCGAFREVAKRQKERRSVLRGSKTGRLDGEWVDALVAVTSPSPGAWRPAE
jgi:hypothetical protein